VRLYFSAVFQHKTAGRSQKIKPLFQQQSRDPYQASLRACNKAATAFEKMRLYFSAVCQPRYPVTSGHTPMHRHVPA
jgi:hypothetical protein